MTYSPVPFSRIPSPDFSALSEYKRLPVSRLERELARLEDYIPMVENPDAVTALTRTHAEIAKYLGVMQAKKAALLSERRRLAQEAKGDWLALDAGDTDR
jgi:hypothetical protein